MFLPVPEVLTNCVTRTVLAALLLADHQTYARNTMCMWPHEDGTIMAFVLLAFLPCFVVFLIQFENHCDEANCGPKGQMVP